MGSGEGRAGVGSTDLGIDGLTEAEHIGSGGAADVYRARQPQLGRTVAVKVLRAASTEENRDRFDRETQTLGRLSTNPGIVTLYQVGRTRFGQPYLLMEYCPGGSLAERVDAEGPLGWDEVASVGAAVGKVLIEAHHAGVLHRDLKPANLLIDQRSNPVVADFGIAALSETGDFSAPVQFTPGYAPPEALSGEPATAAGDVYSLGATLHGLLTGRAPFEDSTGSNNVLAWIRRIDTEPPEDLRPLGVSDADASLIEWAMAKDPSGRPGIETLTQRLEASNGGLAPSFPPTRTLSPPVAPSVPSAPPADAPAPPVHGTMPVEAALPHKPSSRDVADRSTDQPVPSPPVAPTGPDLGTRAVETALPEKPVSRDVAPPTGGDRRFPARWVVLAALAFVVLLAGGLLTRSLSDPSDTGRVEAGATTSAEPGEDPTSDTAPPDDEGVAEGDSEHGTSGAEPVTASGDGRLAEVVERGVLRCGVNGALPGFGLQTASGEFEGFDVDFCRVVAAGVLGDSSAVEFVPLTAAERFTALQVGDIDVLIRNTTRTASREVEEGVRFLFTTFYDGQGLMVPTASGVGTLEELGGSRVCVLGGTTSEVNLDAALTGAGVDATIVVFEDSTALWDAYTNGQCDAVTSDVTQLATRKAVVETAGGQEQFILSEVLSKEPLSPAVLQGDDEWEQVANWSVMATVLAWEYGLDAENIATYDGDDPSILTFVGRGGPPPVPLRPDFTVDIVTQVGNYEQIFERNLAPLGLRLEGSDNDLSSNGGLLFVPPYR